MTRRVRRAEAASAHLTIRVTVLEEQMRSRDDLIAYLRDQLSEADARFHVLLSRLDAVQRHADELSARALPPASTNGRRRWWPFRS